MWVSEESLPALVYIARIQAKRLTKYLSKHFAIIAALIPSCTKNVDAMGKTFLLKLPLFLSLKGCGLTKVRINDVALVKRSDSVSRPPKKVPPRHVSRNTGYRKLQIILKHFTQFCGVIRNEQKTISTFQIETCHRIIFL